MGIEPSPDGVREAAGASGGQGSEIFCNGELVEPEAKYETRVTDSHLGHKSVSPKRANCFALFRFCEAEQCFLTTENSEPGSRKFRATARNYL